jgi:hypothetical protein
MMIVYFKNSKINVLPGIELKDIAMTDFSLRISFTAGGNTASSCFSTLNGAAVRLSAIRISCG